MNILTKKYKISLFGEQYSFVGDEHDEHVQAAAKLFDTLMREIADKTQIVDAKRIAILAGLQLAGYVHSMEQQIDQHQKVHENILERLNKLERDVLAPRE